MNLNEEVLALRADGPRRFKNPVPRLADHLCPSRHVAVSSRRLSTKLPRFCR
jgi:hypothetical protein